MAEVTTNILVVWASIGVAVLVILSTAFPKILGPISKGLADWASSRRRRAQEEEDFRFADAAAELKAARVALVSVRDEIAGIRLEMATMWEWAWITYSEVLKRGSGAPWSPPPIKRQAPADADDS